MVVVRDAQLAAMQDLEQQSFSAQVQAFLERKHPGALGADDLVRLVHTSLSTCLAHGIDREAAVMEFAEAMLGYSRGPLTAGDAERAAGAVLQEFKLRKVWANLVALKVLDRQAAATGSGPSSTAEETET